MTVLFDSPEGRAVVGQDDQLGFSLTDHLLGLFVAQHVFPTFHHQLETGVDGLQGLFLDIETHVPSGTAPNWHESRSRHSYFEIHFVTINLYPNTGQKGSFLSTYLSVRVQSQTLKCEVSISQLARQRKCMCTRQRTNVLTVRG